MMLTMLWLLSVLMASVILASSPSRGETNDQVAVPSHKGLYFGYGSNLWRTQMEQRCPTSEFLGIARLDGYRWIINKRGYANVVQFNLTDPHTGYPTNDTTDNDVVWGAVYYLNKQEEAKLDREEHVPWAYTKEYMPVKFWPKNTREPSIKDLPMLVYIDRKRVVPGKPRKEYLYRMNMAIRDALQERIPRKYVDKYLRKYIQEDWWRCDNPWRYPCNI
ncbi:hypothetical protein K470DRAFT_255202 [Piedraia hortae CBS 480.64]|uniref:gamma-glutamylcyclotransferase n=1 Tax=Piedraia hortae CBS 480.64 TaxID=1314780 RepID=A0A6A7C764_9PEZI|nr:hypothetical protein K470DRAFT_255202 [Piedraia hortae CBS 480.64]